MVNRSGVQAMIFDRVGRVEKEEPYLKLWAINQACR